MILAVTLVRDEDFDSVLSRWYLARSSVDETALRRRLRDQPVHLVSGGVFSEWDYLCCAWPIAARKFSRLRPISPGIDSTRMVWGRAETKSISVS